MSPAHREAYAARRRALAARAPGRLRVAAGAPAPRNLPSIHHPYRASSHFLHLVGEGIPSAVLVLDGTESVLYRPEVDETDRLFHGEPESDDALAERLGLSVRPLSTCPASVDAFALPRPHDAPLDPAHADFVEHLVRARIEHDALALDALRRAASTAVEVHRLAMRITRPGMSSRALRSAVAAAFAARGAALAYPPICTPHGDVLHAGEVDLPLTHDALVLLDAGGESREGYAADVTRTFPASGRFTDGGRALVELVTEAQRQVIDAVRPGVRTRELQWLAHDALAAGLVALGVLRGDPHERARDGSTALFFPHGVGHLLGLDVHDVEDLGDLAGYAPGRVRDPRPELRYLRMDRDLAPGMAITVEPGVYFAPARLDAAETRRAYAGRVDFAAVDGLRALRGVRVEDDVVVGAPGEPAEVLTARAPRHPDAIEAEVGLGADLDAWLARS